MLIVENISLVRVIDLFVEGRFDSEAYFFLLSSLLTDNVLAFFESSENATLVLFDRGNGKFIARTAISEISAPFSNSKVSIYSFLYFDGFRMNRKANDCLVSGFL